MWLLFGLAAIIFAGFNLIFAFRNQDVRWFRFLSLAMTALTICAFYSNSTDLILQEDWGGLMDTMPTIRTALWVCTIASILINSISLFKEKK